MIRPRSLTRHENLSVFWLAAALLFSVIAACSDDAPPATPGRPGAGVYVQEAWQKARQVNGHAVHVQDQRIPCAQCHELGETSLGLPSPERCAACHTEEGRLEHASLEAEKRFGPGTKTDCTGCHAFTIEGTGHAQPSAKEPQDCLFCHTEPQGKVPPIEVHAESECVSCHLVHEEAKPSPAPCSSCHHDISSTHGDSHASETEVCTTCHTHLHAEASDAGTQCAACHAEHQPRIPPTATFADGHPGCVTCHQPHAFSADGAAGCRSCHEGLSVLGASHVPQHAVCTSCHDPHAVRGTPQLACARCHAGVHPDHPATGKAGCLGCHDPHPAGAHAGRVATACSGCHRTAASDHAFHGAAACTACHKPHGFRIAKSAEAPCRECHASEVQHASTLSGHGACEGCHAGLPHHPAAATGSCGSCHAGVHDKAMPGHQACTGCHEPHGGTLAASCDSCHRAEATSAPKGHQACTGCHEPHTGTMKRACESCHAAEKRSGHGSVSGGCTSCHRPHGPGPLTKAPSCQSCHAPQSLPGLHREARHQDCTRCHGGHAQVTGAERSGCLSCHTDRRQHFPDAARCTSCHLFTKGAFSGSPVSPR